MVPDSLASTAGLVTSGLSATIPFARASSAATRSASSPA